MSAVSAGHAPQSAAAAQSVLPAVPQAPPPAPTDFDGRVELVNFRRRLDARGRVRGSGRECFRPAAPRLFARAAAPTPAAEQLTLLFAFVANLTPIVVLAAAALPS